MAVRVAINGFGRIGRLVARAIFDLGRKDVEVVVINDLADLNTNAHLFKYDSVHGRYPGTVEASDSALIIDGQEVKVVQQPDPSKLPWGDMGIDVAMECSGRFTKRDAAAQHLAAGAKKVLISAPGTDEDITVVYGVNHDQLTADLPGAGRLRAAQRHRHRARVHDDDPQLHGRPADRRHPAQ